MEEIQQIATGPFVDPIIQEYSLGRPIAHDFDWAIEVGYKPGVTDNVGRTAREAVELLIHRKFTSEEGVYTSILYLLKGKIDRRQVETIATGLLANTLIQRFAIKDRASWDPKEGMGAYVSKVAARNEIRVAEIDLQISDPELLRISSGTNSRLEPQGNEGP